MSCERLSIHSTGTSAGVTVARELVTSRLSRAVTVLEQLTGPTFPAGINSLCLPQGHATKITFSKRDCAYTQSFSHHLIAGMCARHRLIHRSDDPWHIQHTIPPTVSWHIANRPSHFAGKSSTSTPPSHLRAIANPVQFPRRDCPLSNLLANSIHHRALRGFRRACSHRPSLCAPLARVRPRP